MSDIESYRYQISPELPKGPSPFQLIAGFNPPDTQVTDAVGRGLGELGNRIAELAIKISAADQNSEVARARANYFSKMKDWTANLDKTDLDPKEYRTEFDRESNSIAGEISRSFRYANSHDQFSIWRTEQDVPLLGETLQKQLTVMNDRFGASLQKDLELLRVNPSYLPTALTNIANAESSGAITRTAAEELRQNVFKIGEIAQVMQEGDKAGSAAMQQRLLNMKSFTHLDPEDRKKLVSDLIFNENVKQQVLIEEDKQLETHYADVLLKARTSKDIYAAIDELKAKQFHNGDITTEWYDKFRRELPSPEKGTDWDKAPPDPATLTDYFTLLGALNNPGTRAPSDPTRFGAMAGRVVTAPELGVWMNGHMMEMGSAYRGEREKIATWKGDVASRAVSKILELRNSDTLKKRFGKNEAKFLQTMGQWETELRYQVQNYNWTDQQADDWLAGKVYGLPDKPVTEDTPTTAQGAALALQAWNRQLPNWADRRQTQNQIESLALAQRNEIAKYFGRDPNAIAQLPAKPTPGQEGYSIGAQGWAAFLVNGNYYAFVPESYDKSKRVDDQTYKGNLKLKQYVGGAWVDIPEPKPAEPKATIPAKTIKDMDRNQIVNKINDLKAQRARAEKFIAYAERVLAEPSPGEDPGQAFFDKEVKQKEINAINMNIANLEGALKERGAR